MRVAFVTDLDASNVHAWSGTISNMREALSRAGLQVETIDRLKDPYSAVFKAKRLVKNIAFKKNYLRDREPLTLKKYAEQIETRLVRMNPDIVFSPATIPIAYLRTEKPIIFWADATFDGMINFYPEFTNLCSETIRNGHNMEQAALANCRLALYSSEWAASTAIEHYCVDSKKIKVVPYGANLRHVPSADEVKQAISARASDVCKLLFVGVDWYRKGGDKAYLVASKLNELGVEAELHVVGCDPPSPLPAFVKTYGFLSKTNHKHNEILSKLYSTSEFLILPSQAEAYGIVMAEANSFGLPAIGTDVGGMRTVVKDGRNGWTFAPSSFVQGCVDYIIEMMSSKDQYRALCSSSFVEYSTRLNWDSAVQSVLSLMASEGILLS